LLDHGIILLVLSSMRITQFDDAGVDLLGNHVVELGFRPLLEAFASLVGMATVGPVSDIRTNRGLEITLSRQLRSTLSICHFE
jgi:hypothetical protein